MVDLNEDEQDFVLISSIPFGPLVRTSPMPTKKCIYTFRDVFCGAGGSSQGAV
jgi:hypothetical protein